MSFEYSILNKDKIAVVSFQGTMDRASTEALDRCVKELLEAAPKAVALNMKAVANIKSEAYRSFAQLGKGLRTARVPYRFAALDPRLKQFLIQDGLLAHAEAKDSLEAALKELVAELATA